MIEEKDHSDQDEWNKLFNYIYIVNKISKIFNLI